MMGLVGAGYLRRLSPIPHYPRGGFRPLTLMLLPVLRTVALAIRLIAQGLLPKVRAVGSRKLAWATPDLLDR